MLRQPILPLVRLVQLLYLTAPFETIQDLLAELTEPINTGTVLYDEPQTLLLPLLDVLQNVERLKNQEPLPWRILSETGDALDPIEALDAWVAQEILHRELEQINSQLCAPCNCDLCCTGPGSHHSQDFFEIPLTPPETKLFHLPHIDTSQSRQINAQSEPPLLRGNRPFYSTGAALYHWHTGWSLILPRNSSCPGLETEKRICLMYEERPDVCRRPQIFPYMLEAAAAPDSPEKPIFYRRQKLLAVWDCPYVRQLQEEIAAYAQRCDLEPVFRENKS